MNPRRIGAVARKEVRHVLRDTRSLALALAIPFLMIILFGYVLTLDVDRVPFMVWDRSRSAESRDLIRTFTGSEYFTLRESVQGYESIGRALTTGEARMALVIPSDFSARIATGRDVDLQVLLDGTDANTALIIRGYLEQISTDYTLRVHLRQARKTGLPGTAYAPPLQLEARVWFNPNLQSKNYIVPGLIAVIMMIIGSLLTSQTVAREWESGTMETLISTPVTPGELILGKLSPYFVLGLVDVLIAVLLGRFLFDVPLRGPRVLLALTSALFMIVALAMGLVISIRTRQQLAAAQISIVLTFLPAFLLSGFIFPIPNMPWPIRWMTVAVPARYFITVSKGVFLKGIGLGLLYPQILTLLVWAGGLVGLGVITFRKRLD